MKLKKEQYGQLVAKVLETILIVNVTYQIHI
jgi:hypothetical protein